MKDYLDLFSAALAPIIAIIAVYIAYRQYRNDMLRLKHDLYEKRLTVFDALMEMIGVILRDATINREELGKFIRATNKGYFLFGQDIAEYLQEVRSKAAALHSISNMLQNENLPVGAERTKLANQENELLMWFTEQIDVSRDKFSKYMSLK